ncbi:extracellular solute-binding protein [Sphingomonas aerophila]|uniref:Multiple sugar transport system substrate-binding protein n=1 Tax=Sphingomonas aerophila TaxID=1344948 RepID=A0A7W9BDV3_9SPHN|nr:extracellular solute-binding protein [Sphingomonas aerophila]MBB5715046.1 multiple sugar transport system substrate-binding protein [Sphingomonas aerophila]
MAAAGIGTAAWATGACTRRADPDALSFWAMGYEGDYSPHLTTAFTRMTGIRVETQTLSWTEAHEKLLTAFAGNSLPDVFMLPAHWVGEFAMVGALARMPDATLLDDMLPGALNLTRAGGSGYAVPWVIGTQVQYYRRDLIEQAGYPEPPADWAEWRQMGLALKRRYPDAFTILLYLNWPEALLTFAAQLGAGLLRDRNTRGDFASPEFREALRFYKSLFDDGLAPRVLATQIQDPVGAFAQGYFAIYPEGPSLLLDMRRRAAEIPPDKWRTATMPTPHGPAAAPGACHTLVVAKTSRRPREAWSLVRHMTSVPSGLRFQRLIGDLPARASAWRDPQLANPTLKPFAEQIAHLSPTPALVEFEQIRAEVQLIAERVVRGLVDVNTATTEMNRRVDLMLAKRRALVEAGRIA